MRIAIAGAGNVGRLYGRRWVSRGHEVAFGYVRDRARLGAFVAGLGHGASVVPEEELLEGADVLVFAPPFEQIEHAADLLGTVGDIPVIDTTNPFNPERTGLVDLSGATSADKVARLFPDARVVKSLHNLSVEQVVGSADADGPSVLFLAGDDPGAKRVVSRLVVDAGLIPADTGSFETARLSEAPGPLFMNPSTVTSVSDAVAAAMSNT